MQPVKKAAHQNPCRSLILPFSLVGLLAGACGPKAMVRAPIPVPGDRVRVTTGDHRVVYEFREVRGDVLVVQSGDHLFSVPLASVDELEAVAEHRSRTQNAMAGAGIGLVVGGGVGALMGLALSSSCGPNDWLCGDPAASAAVGAMGLGCIAVPLGLIIGTVSSTAVWRPVESTAFRVQAGATGGLGVVLRWRP